MPGSIDVIIGRLYAEESININIVLLYVLFVNVFAPVFFS